MLSWLPATQLSQIRLLPVALLRLTAAGRFE
jgi:hypothetical protein